MDEVQSRLDKVAHAAREILQANCTLHFGFADFPAGTCGVTAELLGRYFKDALGLGATYICGQRAEKSHAWVNVGGIIVDITADQFDEGQAPVIVTKQSLWHEQWKAEEPKQICYPQDWPDYPIVIWHALIEGVAERGFPRPGA